MNGNQIADAEMAPGNENLSHLGPSYIRAFYPDKGFGFIQTEQECLFFSSTDVEDDRLRQRLEGFSAWVRIAVLFQWAPKYSSEKMHNRAVNVWAFTGLDSLVREIDEHLDAGAVTKAHKLLELALAWYPDHPAIRHRHQRYYPSLTTPQVAALHCAEEGADHYSKLARISANRFPGARAVHPAGYVSCFFKDRRYGFIVTRDGAFLHYTEEDIKDPALLNILRLVPNARGIPVRFDHAAKRSSRFRRERAVNIGMEHPAIQELELARG